MQRLIGNVRNRLGLARRDRAFSHLWRPEEVALRARYHKPKSRTITLPTGQEMSGLLPEDMFSALYQGLPLETDTIGLLSHVLEPGLTFYDVGAHFGYVSLMALEMLGETGEVHAFEPIPYVRRFLRNNLGPYGDRAHISDKVLTKQPRGTEALYHYGIQFSGLSSLHALQHDTHNLNLPQIHVKMYDCPTTNLDTYSSLGANHIPDVIKIDVEGSELDVLLGGAECIERYSPVILFEGGDIFSRVKNTTRTCVDFLERFDYSFFTYDIQSGDLIPHTKQSEYSHHLNILAIKK